MIYSGNFGATRLMRKDNIFSWKNREQCLSELLIYSSDILTDSLRERIQEAQPDGCWEDDMSWALVEDIDLMVAEQFRDYYSHVLAFHACRPVSLISYLKDGLKAHNLAVLEADFHSIFSDVSEEIRNRAIELNKNFLNESGKLFFVGNDDELIWDSGHYLINGSEHIMGLAARLCELTGKDYRLRLRERGVSTMLQVHIPIEKISEPQILATSKQLIALWGNSFCFSDEMYSSEASYVVYGDLPPSCIVDHYHPMKIRDPHNMFITYNEKNTLCDGCTKE